MATNEYPKMLFKYPSETVDNIECVDGRFDIIAVDSKEEEVAAIKEGWFFTPPEAKKAGTPKKPTVKKDDWK